MRGTGRGGRRVRGTGREGECEGGEMRERG